MKKIERNKTNSMAIKNEESDADYDSDRYKVKKIIGYEKSKFNKKNL
jgi:hypothetical protein